MQNIGNYHLNEKMTVALNEQFLQKQKFINYRLKYRTVPGYFVIVVFLHKEGKNEEGKAVL